MINNLKRIFLLFLVVNFICLNSFARSTKKDTQKNKLYLIGIVPQLIPTETHRIWAPIVAKLSSTTNLNFELKIYESIPKFESDFLNGQLDLALLNPYHAVMAKRAQGYIPLIRDSAHLLSGILVVQKNSEVKSIKELAGKNIVFPAPNSFGASLYIRALLTEKEKINFTPIYQKTHSNVYRHVIFGEALAGGGVNNTLKRESADVQTKLRILYETPAVPPHPLVAHPRFPKSLRTIVTDAFFEMNKNPESQKLLEEAQISKPIIADYARDYKQLEKLKLDKYVVMEKE